MIRPNGSLRELTEEGFQTLLTINVTGLVLRMKHEIVQFLRQMETDATELSLNFQPNESYENAGPYTIINNASLLGIRGPPHAMYTTNKLAVLGITRSTAAEYAHRGIRVNAINYGCMSRKGNGELSVSYMLLNVPMNRLGQEVEVAKVAAWLASNASSYLTGSAIVCDGGCVLLSDSGIDLRKHTFINS